MLVTPIVVTELLIPLLNVLVTVLDVIPPQVPAPQPLPVVNVAPPAGI